MKSKKTFLILTAFVLLGLLLSCSKKENQSGQTGDAESGFELNFEVNSALLGERIDVADLEFAAPRGWSSVPEKIMEMMRKHAAKDTGKLGMIPEYAFSSDNGSVLVISRFINRNQPGSKFSDWATEVGQTYADIREGHSTDSRWISLNNIEALRITTNDLRTIHLKVLVNAKEPVSIDYTIPKEIWGSVKDTIGSSLGSLMRLDDK